MTPSPRGQAWLDEGSVEGKNAKYMGTAGLERSLLPGIGVREGFHERVCFFPKFSRLETFPVLWAKVGVCGQKTLLLYDLGTML